MSEKNLVKSFRRVKSDIIDMQSQIYELNQKLEKILSLVMTPKHSTVSQPAAKKKDFVASKTGKKFHIRACPFAKNIKPKSKVTFASKNTALNNGYKACDCVKN